MSYREVGRNATDIKKEKGKPFTGIYLGSRGITTKIGPQVIYSFESEHGEKYQIYGFTMLNYGMGNVQVGELCRITYLGTKLCETKFGKKDVHQVLVEVDDKNGQAKNSPNSDGMPF